MKGENESTFSIQGIELHFTYKVENESNLFLTYLENTGGYNVCTMSSEHLFPKAYESNYKRSSNIGHKLSPPSLNSSGATRHILKVISQQPSKSEMLSLLADRGSKAAL